VSDSDTFGSRIRTEFGRIGRELELVRQLNSLRANRSLDLLELHAAARALHSVYTGIERAISIAVRAMGVDVPSSSGWHQELLRIAEASAIVDRALIVRLRELMGFRHFYRHAYGFMLDADLLAPLLDDVGPPAYEPKSALLQTERPGS
jgi:hypothetical protein